MTKRQSKKKQKEKAFSPLDSIRVEGYKCLSHPCELKIRPITILAGANSAGKSSALQPLLLLKQTLEAGYDPGILQLNGDNVHLTSCDQIFAKISPRKTAKHFSVRLTAVESFIENTYERRAGGRIDLVQTEHAHLNNKAFSVRPGMTEDQIDAALSHVYGETRESLLGTQYALELELRVTQSRIFLKFELGRPDGEFAIPVSSGGLFGPDQFEDIIRALIHIPGLRGNPERVYRTTGTGPQFPGTFENYVASIIRDWQVRKDGRLSLLADALERLGLTSEIRADRMDETRVELLVGRLPHGGKTKKPEMVNIADVGFGVSQTLPVVVALLAAHPGQTVYIEQPEIHLHPKAQVAMAGLLVDAAKRDVHVVVETHSDLILLALQSLVAEGAIEAEKTQLHWFQRNEKDGVTEVNSAPLERNGSFGDWPEDFGQVSLELQSRYMDAAERLEAAAG